MFGNIIFAPPEVKIALVVAFAIIAVVSYLLGSISFAVIFTKKFANTDVREHGSGNAGMTNVMRTAGKLPGILTFLGDFLKGTASSAIGMLLINPLTNALILAQGQEFIGEYVYPVIAGAFAGLFCLVGHMWPIFFGFRGGKGVATIVGLAVSFSPLTSLTCFAIFIILILLTKIVSLSSIIAVACATPVHLIYFKAQQYPLFTENSALVVSLIIATMSVLIIARHHENIVRLFKGTERKIGSKKKG